MRTAKILLLYLYFNELPSSNFIETCGYCVHCFGVRVIRAVTKIFKLLGKIIHQVSNESNSHGLLLVLLFFCDFLMIVRVNLIKLLQDTDNITMATCTLALTLLVHVKVLLNLP